MGKKNKNLGDVSVAAVEKRSGPDGGILFEANESTLEETTRALGLTHVNKPWSRLAYERAWPWLLSQRQKLEGNGWSNGDAIRTELFVLKRTAPSGVFTEDGFIYLRVPKKMIDYFRTAKKHNADDEEGDGDAGTKRHLSSRASKKREMRCNYDLSEPDLWRIKIEHADSEDPNMQANVQVDVHEAMENIFYLVMVLQPGLVRLHAWRDNVIQPGTHEIDVREDAEPPTARHRAMIAAKESYARSLPPAYWFKRNRDELEKILGEGFEPTLKAAEDAARLGASIRAVKGVEEKVWEEIIKVDPKVASAAGKKKKGTKKSQLHKVVEKQSMMSPPTTGAMTAAA